MGTWDGDSTQHQVLLHPSWGVMLEIGGGNGRTTMLRLHLDLSNLKDWPRGRLMSAPRLGLGEDQPARGHDTQHFENGEKTRVLSHPVPSSLSSRSGTLFFLTFLEKLMRRCLS